MPVLLGFCIHAFGERVRTTFGKSLSNTTLNFVQSKYHRSCIRVDMAVQVGGAGEGQLFCILNLTAEIWKIVDKKNN